MSKLAPWEIGPLCGWSICGMNHYHVAGEKFIFVSMTKSGICITEEGKDDKYLWNRLCHKAEAINDDFKAAVEYLEREKKSLIDSHKEPLNGNRISDQAVIQDCKTIDVILRILGHHFSM